jgi:hypothetical protein
MKHDIFRFPSNWISPFPPPPPALSLPLGLSLSLSLAAFFSLRWNNNALGLLSSNSCDSCALTTHPHVESFFVFHHRVRLRIFGNILSSRWFSEPRDPHLHDERQAYGMRGAAYVKRVKLIVITVIDNNRYYSGEHWQISSFRHSLAGTIFWYRFSGNLSNDSFCLSLSPREREIEI